MIIRLHNAGRIEAAPGALTEGLNSIGQIKGFVNPDTFEVSDMQGRDVAALEDSEVLYLYGDAIVFRVEGDRLAWIAPDISGQRDVFYARVGEDAIAISDDFFTLAEALPSASQNDAATGFFLAHGYFAPGQTFLNEIHRVRVGNRLLFSDMAGPVEESVFDSISAARPRDSFACFRSSFRSMMQREAASCEDVILLSGGCDSGLILALFCDELGLRPRTATMSYAQPSSSNAKDVATSKALASFYGLEQDIVQIDFDALDVSSLQPIADTMPLSAHLGINFLALMQTTQAAGAHRLWCGQNADTLYNLGPTGRFNLSSGKSPFLKRCFLTQEYFKTFPDIKENSILSPLTRFTGSVAAMLLSRSYARDLRQPHSFHELLTCYQQSESYLALRDANTPPTTPYAAPATTRQAREQLFDQRISSYLVGRDARVIHAAASLTATHALLPFSTPNMVLFFRSLEMGWRDVIWPKRFIYGYLKELMGHKAYANLYPSQAPPAAKNALTKEAWDQDMLANTALGRQLTDIAHDVDLSLFSTFKQTNLQHHVSWYWLKRVRERLDKSSAAAVSSHT